MTTKLIENFHHQQAYASPVALELEMEFQNMVDRHPQNARDFGSYWKHVREGSLRGHNTELISKPAFNLDTKNDALKLVWEYYKYYHARPSVRSSTHVHVNMQETTWKEICTAMAVYWYLEPALLSFCGDHRVGNHFCLGVEEADYFPLNIKRYINRGQFYTGLNHMFRDDLRYSALNPMSLVKFGSLEFRAMRGTDDTDLVDKWLQMCYDICKVGVQFKDPAQFLDFVYGQSPKVVAREILKDNSVLLDYSVANTNLGLLSDFAYDTDWGKDQDDVNPQAVKEQPEPRGRHDLNRLVGQHFHQWQVAADNEGAVAAAGGGGVEPVHLVRWQWENRIEPIPNPNPEEPEDDEERLRMEEEEELMRMEEELMRMEEDDFDL